MTEAPTTSPQTQDMVCASCGAKVRAGARFCDECGTSVRASGAPASFGARYAAFLVDLTVVVLGWFLVSLVIQPIVRMLPAPGPSGVEIGAFTATLGSLIGITMLPIVAIIYTGASDAHSRTIGKRIVGIRVRRTDKTSAGWLRSLLRASVLWGPILLMALGNVFDVYGSTAIGITLVRIAAPLALIAWPATLILIAAKKHKRGLDDLIAGTETVRD